VRLSSIEKSLKIVDLLGEYPRGLSLSELNVRLGFPPSTIHHILSTLRDYNYISQDIETKKYQLGFKFLSISSIILDNLGIRRKAYRHMQRLHQLCNETVNLWILRGGRVTLIDKIQRVGGLSLDTYIGYSTDPHAAASGKVLISELEENEIREIYKTRPLRAYAKNTITNLTRLLEELDNIRKQGYAIDNEEYYEGVRCVAAPIRFEGNIKAAISITGSIFSISMERMNQELIELITETAKEVSAELP
jgi:DNA-binding IclR family transcriptional regulator